MNQELNFLYCFDRNYNMQAFSSIISILEKIKEKINIHIIHSEDNIDNLLPQVIRNHKNLNNVFTYKFIDYDHYFPNIEGVHISLATYFRLFIANYIPKEIKNLVFLDADIICTQDPISELRKEIDKLNKSEYIISARTEHPKERVVKNDIFKRLEMNGPYFNAGVMLINFERWQKEDLHKKLISELEVLKDKIYQWDQDVINSYFDGSYLELSEKFNFPSYYYKKKNNFLDIIFIHYLGSKKPWLSSGVFQNESIYYHQNYKKIAEKNYHIIHKWKKTSVIDLLKAILSLRILRLQNPFIYIKEFLQSLNKH